MNNFSWTIPTPELPEEGFFNKLAGLFKKKETAIKDRVVVTKNGFDLLTSAFEMHLDFSEVAAVRPTAVMFTTDIGYTAFWTILQLELKTDRRIPKTVMNKIKQGTVPFIVDNEFYKDFRGVSEVPSIYITTLTGEEYEFEAFEKLLKFNNIPFASTRLIIKTDTVEEYNKLIDEYIEDKEKAASYKL